MRLVNVLIVLMLAVQALAGPPVQPLAGSSVNLAAMGVASGSVIELAPGVRYENIVVRPAAGVRLEGVTVAVKDDGTGRKAVVGRVDVGGEVRDLTLRGLEVVGDGSGVGIEVVAAAGQVIDGLMIESCTVRRQMKGICIDSTGGSVRSAYLVGNVIEECGSLGVFANNSAGLMEGNIIDRCGGQDPNRDPTMTRGVYLTSSAAWVVRGNLITRCAMNGVRGGTVVTENVIIGCGVGIVVGEGGAEVSGNAVWWSRDVDPANPARAISGGVEVSGGVACLVRQNVVAAPRSRGPTWAFMAHGDQGRRYGPLKFVGNAAVGFDEFGGVGYGMDEWMVAGLSGGMAGNVAVPTGVLGPESSVLSRAFDIKGGWIVPPGGMRVVAPAGMVDHARSPATYITMVTGGVVGEEEAIGAVVAAAKGDGSVVQKLRGYLVVAGKVK